MLIVGNAGIGVETVRGLATRGATVIIGSRDVKKAQHAVQKMHNLSGKHHGADGDSRSSLSVFMLFIHR